VSIGSGEVGVVYHDLEPIEAMSFGSSRLIRETLTEGEDIGYMK
jgi:hypothetical protein